MAPEKAVAQVFMTAFKALSVKDQRAFLMQVTKARKWRNDLRDIAVAELRSGEKARPFRNFLREIQK